MGKKKQTHVTHDKDKGDWGSKDTGNQKASKRFPTKKEAVDWARDHSRKEGNELVIHKKDGTIGEKDSHGNDPYPPKG